MKKLKRQQQKIDIVLLTYNRLNYLKQTIEALIQNTTYPFNLIVVDNASTDPQIKKYLKKQQQKKIINKTIFLEKNNYMESWKQGIEQISSEIFGISDPDIIVPKLKPCWLTQILKYFDKYNEIVRLALSLKRENIPPCWNTKQKKQLALKTGPLFKKNKDLRLGDALTTMQLIRKNIYEQIPLQKNEKIDLKYWKKFRTYGVSAITQNIEALHLGWNEYLDYPDYLREKDGKLGKYKESELIK